MWLKLVCIVVIASGVVAKQDELLDELYGVEGRNRMAICVRTGGGRWRHCDGALVNREWVVAHARCLGAASSADMAAERLSAGGTCQLMAAGNTGLYRSRAVRHHVMHPWFDLAIVIMKTPYNNLDRLANATRTRLKLRQHG